MSPTIIQALCPTVHTRRRWSDPWAPAPGLYCLECAASLQPAMPAARLAYSYGRIYEGAATPHDAEPLAAEDYLDAYVQVRHPQTNAVLWQGRITELEDTPGDTSPDRAPGDQTLQAQGLECILARIQIDGSHALIGERVVRIDTILPFNLADRPGQPPQGNRSKDRQGDSYVFADDGETWSAMDALEYLLARFGPPALAIRIAGPLGNLQLQERAWQPAASLLGCLNQLIDRRRGVAWRLTFEDTPHLELYPVFDAQVRLGGAAPLEPNRRVFTAVLDDNEIETASIRASTAHRYDRLVVRGGPLVVCGSMSARAGSLRAGWSAPSQKAYLAADDATRLQERFAHVFTTLVTAQGEGRQLHIFDDDAGDAISGSRGLPGIKADGQVDFRRRDGLFLRGRCLLRGLPLRPGWDYSGRQPRQTDPDAPDELLALLAWGQAEQGDGQMRYVPLDRPCTAEGAPHTAPMTIGILDGEIGLRIRPPAGLGTYLARGDLTDAHEPSILEPAFNWRDLVFTVAVAADDRLAVEAELNPKPGDNPTTLYIDVPDAECWVLLGGTALDVDDEGELRKASHDLELRNDRDKLLRIAELARAWYGKTRQAASWTHHRIHTALSPGDLVQTLNAGRQERQIHALVSMVEHRFDQQTTRVNCDFGELDWIQFGAAPSGGPTGLGAQALGAFSAPTVRDKLANQPVRIAAPSPAAAGLRIGVVLDGRETIPPQEGVYPLDGEGRLAGVYFDEVSPLTLERFAGSATRDVKDNWLTTAIASPYDRGPNSDAKALDIGAFFRFTQIEGAWRIVDCLPPVFLPVRLYKTDGSPGTSTTQCSFTYTARTMDAQTVLGSGLTPERRRPSAGPLIPPPDGTVGIGYFRGKTFGLWDANEALDTTACT